MEQSNLIHKINAMPQDLQAELDHFIDFLLSKKPDKNGKHKPQFGCAKGLIQMAPDFDEPLEDFKSYM